MRTDEEAARNSRVEAAVEAEEEAQEAEPALKI